MNFLSVWNFGFILIDRWLILDKDDGFWGLVNLFIVRSLRATLGREFALWEMDRGYRIAICVTELVVRMNCGIEGAGWLGIRHPPIPRLRSGHRLP
jgi:hypothetical protein